MKLKDRVAIITGATSGIGETSALLFFAQQGSRVTVNALRELAENRRFQLDNRTWRQPLEQLDTRIR